MSVERRLSQPQANAGNTESHPKPAPAPEQRHARRTSFETVLVASAEKFGEAVGRKSGRVFREMRDIYNEAQAISTASKEKAPVRPTVVVDLPQSAAGTTEQPTIERTTADVAAAPTIETELPTDARPNEKPAPPEAVPPKKKREVSVATREKISKALTGKKHTAEHNAHVREAWTPEKRAEHSERMKQIWTPEMRAAQRERTLKRIAQEKMQRAAEATTPHQDGIIIPFPARQQEEAAPNHKDSRRLRSYEAASTFLGKGRVGRLASRIAAEALATPLGRPLSRSVEARTNQKNHHERAAVKPTIIFREGSAAK